MRRPTLYCALTSFVLNPALMLIDSQRLEFGSRLSTPRRHYEHKAARAPIKPRAPMRVVDTAEREMAAAVSV